MNRFAVIILAVFASAVCSFADIVTIDVCKNGIKPGMRDVSGRVARLFARYSAASSDVDTVVLSFAKGRYDFYPDKSEKRSLYISNHDQTNPKHIGLLLENARNIVVDGNGSDFVFHGRMLPFAVRGCKNVTLRNFSIDFENPHIAQVTVVRSDDSGISFNPAPWVKWRITKSGVFETFGHGWNAVPVAGIAFEPDTRRIVYRTSDLSVPLDSVVRNSDGSLRAPRWIDKRLVGGTVVALRTYDRPAPGIFLDENKDTRIENVQVRYAEGMGLLAQLCSNISLDGFSVCLRGEDDPRYFTTQADATHFSACEGLIDSRNGLYEGMMDDAINVHGTYLRITSASADGRVVHGRYMHPQAYGFKWGEPGDSVQFVLSRTMETFGNVNVIDSVVPVDASSQDGAKEFRITLREAIDLPLSEHVGIENLRWTPEVVFTENIIRNNRARGTLFSTPRKVVVTDNIFDHTSGSAILLCGDCNGWYETGACRDVRISGNRFVNALTSPFQFTEAVISVYPEIPDIESQTKYFHGGTGNPGIVIENNVFETFDQPLLYVKSADGVRFVANKVMRNNDYEPYHPNGFTFRFIRVSNVTIEENDFGGEESSLKID